MTSKFWIQDPLLLFAGIKSINDFIPKKGQSFATNINAFTRTVLILLNLIFVFGWVFRKMKGSPSLLSCTQMLRITVSILLGLGLISLISLMSEGYLYASPSLKGAHFKADKKQVLFSGKAAKEPYFAPPHFKTIPKYRDKKYMFLEPEAENPKDHTENFQYQHQQTFFGEPIRHKEQNSAITGDVNALLKRYKTVRQPFPELSGGNGNPSIDESDQMSRIGNRVAYNRVTKPRIIDASNLAYNERGIKYRPYHF
jgi:hypothetical protein